MDESILDRLMQLKQQMAEAVERSVVRHPEYGEQRLRDELAPFIGELDNAAKMYEDLLQNRPQKKKIEIPAIRLSKTPAPTPAVEGPQSREEFIELFHFKPDIVESAIDRLLGRKAATPSAPPIPAFADWATQSAGGSVVATTMADDSTVRTADPAPADWDSWLAKTGAEPPVNVNAPVANPGGAPTPAAGTTAGLWSWANQSGGQEGGAAHEALSATELEQQKRLREWLERRKKSGA